MSIYPIVLIVFVLSATDPSFFIEKAARSATCEGQRAAVNHITGCYRCKYLHVTELYRQRSVDP